MSQVSANGYRLNDTVSYKYNGMTGKITQIVTDTLFEVTFPSANRSGGILVVNLSINEIELVAGSKQNSSQLVSA